MVDFTIEDGILIKCNSNIGQALFSYEIKEVGVEAFIGRTKLKGIKFTDGLIKINKRAFYNCYLLREVILPDSLVTIENGAFTNCVCLDDKSRKLIISKNPMAFL